jgi:MYXO-CTERM domain-containing protein
MHIHCASSQSWAHLLGAVGLILLGSSSITYGDEIDFEGLSHGEIVSNQYLASGVLVTAVNPNRPFDLAIAFDTNQTGTADPDLEGPNWSGGNLAPIADLGNILVISENDYPQSSPDDEGMSPAGQLIFDFDTPILEFGIDLIDLDHPDTTPTYLRFFGEGNLVLEIDVSDFTNQGSDLYDPSITYGEHSANRLAPISLLPPPEGDDAFTWVTRVEVGLGESGGVDNLFYTTVPSPGALALLGLAALAGRVYRRRHVGER